MAAVALPQLFHVIGAVSVRDHGVAFLPMHSAHHLRQSDRRFRLSSEPSPSGGLLVSFLLSGMPMLLMLPLMMIELCATSDQACCVP